ncbi:MAG: hypothetical protein IPN68_11460 [Bacteroidetes bacterium]|nr:hypothetical protein [Bacteroidota bacterium]
MYLGNIAGSENRISDAKNYYERVIELSRKYFEAYVELAGLIGEQDIMRTRRLLRRCLTMNPGFRPAIVALADTYRKSDPEVAAKYDKLADSVK